MQDNYLVPMPLQLAIFLRMYQPIAFRHFYINAGWVLGPLNKSLLGSLMPAASTLQSLRLPYHNHLPASASLNYDRVMYS